ncbi:MAG: PepSY-associated TM helix domain-containing protein [Bacteroidales bacterium]|nr:PepSY-associated TM helix domain-containing protein [Bacteroidales bacterium]
MMKWRKWNRVLHRDFGYFFVAMSIIYGISGIALNHINDWNPNYIIQHKEINLNRELKKENINQQTILSILKETGEEKNYKKYFFPADNTLKIFLKGGSIVFDLGTGKGTLEKIKRRPFFHEVNFLHYNPGKLWIWFSDIYAGALVLLAITGLFILKGKNGITGRGAWLTIAGLIIPILFLLFL